MILIGQFDSPFVRRVGVALRLYGIPFEHRPWSVFSDADKVAQLNPVVRVPTFVTGHGLAFGGTDAILDYVDSLVPAERRLYPQAQPARVEAMAVSALASGLSDKAVALFYERVMHERPSPTLAARFESQIRGAATALEREREKAGGAWWQGAGIGHCDIAVACAIRHCVEALPDVLDMGALPALAAHCSRCEALPVFREVSQPFIPPA